MQFNSFTFVIALDKHLTPLLCTLVLYLFHAPLGRCTNAFPCNPKSLKLSLKSLSAEVSLSSVPYTNSQVSTGLFKCQITQQSFGEASDEDASLFHTANSIDLKTAQFTQFEKTIEKHGEKSKRMEKENEGKTKGGEKDSGRNLKLLRQSSW